MKSNPPETNAEALTLLADAIGMLRAIGFVVTGGVTVSKPATLAPAVYDRFDAPGRPVQLATLPPMRCKTRYYPTGTPTRGEKRISVSSAGIGANDGLVREGGVCPQCSGAVFRRTGPCLVCHNCGTSVGGCG